MPISFCCRRRSLLCSLSLLSASCKLFNSACGWRGKGPLTDYSTHFHIHGCKGFCTFSLLYLRSKPSFFLIIAGIFSSEPFFSKHLHNTVIHVPYLFIHTYAYVCTYAHKHCYHKHIHTHARARVHTHTHTRSLTSSIAPTLAV